MLFRSRARVHLLFYMRSLGKTTVSIASKREHGIQISVARATSPIQHFNIPSSLRRGCLEGYCESLCALLSLCVSITLTHRQSDRHTHNPTGGQSVFGRFDTADAVCRTGKRGETDNAGIVNHSFPHRCASVLIFESGQVSQVRV